ncbi:RDD family protein [Acinetobacter pragensis]|uniref:RDD family protein n=1 Tax=Acinetobacter pragensis TaxID=1806892 RepID=A0A151Y3D3_9GAMM|nr:RDD family protein [Acinetobacter pragensis]KYQ72545.1 RDD family protein [Acinetobacter pragensis]
MQIYLARNNQQAGPYSLEQVNQMLADQQVLLTDLAWHQGMAEWKALGELTQGKPTYQPEGFSVSANAQPLNTQSPLNQGAASQNPAIQNSSAQNTAKTSQQTLASIPSRVLAKIADLLLWVPATYILTGFFSKEEAQQFNTLNIQFMDAVFGTTANPVLAQELQTKMIEMFSQQAWFAMGAYLFIMLAVQAFLIAKTGQSIGKKLTKIKIVDAETGEKTSLMRAFTLRSVLFIFLNFVFLFIAIIDLAFGFGAKRQTLHDKIAKTKVIKQ